MADASLTSEPEKLLPCPFCGARDEYNPSLTPVRGYAEPGNAEAGLVDTGWLVECDKCTGLGPSRTTRGEAITAWNTRLSSPVSGTDMVMREKAAKIADDLWGDGPSGSYDNGATSDGWNMACNAIAAAIRALSSSPTPPIPMIAEAGEREGLGWRLERIVEDGGPLTLSDKGVIREAIAALSTPATLDNTAVEGRSCKTCKGRRKVVVLEGTCEPQHEAPCPTCVGTTFATLTAKTEKAE